MGLEAGPWDSRNDNAVHGGVERRREARGGRAQHLVRAQRDLECRTMGPPQMLDARAARASRVVPGSRRHRIHSTVGVPPARILPIKEVLHHPANLTQRSWCAPLRGRTPSLRWERRRRCGQAPPAAPCTPEGGKAPARATDAAHANKHTHTHNAPRVRARCGGGQLGGQGVVGVPAGTDFSHRPGGWQARGVRGRRGLGGRGGRRRSLYGTRAATRP
mgnify:CR=1 FL=1